MRHPTALVLLACLAAPLVGQDWPTWRGPNGDGTTADRELPESWSRDENVIWRTPLARPGNGSPIVASDAVFVTMAEDEEGKRRSLYCFDRNTGAERWVRTVEIDRVMPTHGTNPHCSTTPATDGERVVVWHASAGLHCYDFDGEPLWEQDLGEFRHPWGHGTSPILWNGRVILHTGPGEEPFLAAFDLATGEELWRTAEPDTRTPEQLEQKRLWASFSTPIVVRHGERDLVLCGQPTRLVAYDASNGEIVFWCHGVSNARGDLVYAAPLVWNDVCFVVGGYEGSTFAVRLGGEGDVTDTHRLWHRPDQFSCCASGMPVDGHFLVPEMGGFLQCIDATTGEPRWRRRVGRGATWSSIVRVGDRLLLTTQSGETCVFRADVESFAVLHRNLLGEESNSTPAVAGDRIYLRTHAALYCIGTDG